MFYTKSRNSEYGYNADQIVEASVEKQEQRSDHKEFYKPFSRIREFVIYPEENLCH